MTRLPAAVQPPELSPTEWSELLALKSAITEHVWSVHPSQMERFTELFARTLQGKGNTPYPAKTHESTRPSPRDCGASYPEHGPDSS